MGVTSTIVFITIETIDVKMIAVPFMIASIPLSIVGGKKSNEYIKRYRSAENKKRRAQMSLSLQLNRADLTIKF
jgi:H+/Cl- antiporter ClcA